MHKHTQFPEWLIDILQEDEKKRVGKRETKEKISKIAFYHVQPKGIKTNFLFTIE